MSLLLGTAREIITPKIGACLYGYKPDWHSTSIADDLTAIAFYFESDGTKALWISVTVCLLNTELHNSIRKKISEETSIPFEHIMISATHTHSGPNTSGEYGWGDVDLEYCDSIYIPALLKVSKDAMSSPIEVEMGIGIGDSDIGVNRREFYADGSTYLGQNPWGCYNPQMTVIAFRDKEHKPVANMVHYGMHGTCAGSNYEISRDWSGVMCDMLEKDSKALTAFVTGPEGDVGPRLSNGYTTGCRDISYVYEFIDGIDKVSRIYNLYTGNLETITEDIITIGTGFVDESGFNYRKQHIDEKVQNLIGAVRCIDVQDQIVEEYIEEHLGKLKPVVVELCDLTRTEVGITPMQARERLDAQLEDIIEPKVTSKVKRLIRKFIPLKKK